MPLKALTDRFPKAFLQNAAKCGDQPFVLWASKSSKWEDELPADIAWFCIQSSKSFGPACVADTAFLLVFGAKVIGACPLGPRSISLGGPSYWSTSAIGLSIRTGAFGLCRRAWREAWSPAVAVFSLDILHLTYTWSAIQTRCVGMVFNRNGACVIWPAAASKVIIQSFLSGQNPINMSGDSNSASS